MGKQKKKTVPTSFIKVVYFDEPSAMDYIYINEGGKKDEQIQSIVEKTIDLSAGAEGKAALGLKLIAKLSGDTEGSFAYEKESMIVKAVQSTVLTDFIAVSAEDDRIKKLDGGSVYPHPDSFTYIKMITPFLIMADGKIPVEEMNLEYSKMDEALSAGRGYYELIYTTESDNDPIVLRFNLNAFRNNYTLSDLPKMNLVYYAIEVGSIYEEQLKGENEFETKEMIDSHKELNALNIVSDSDTDTSKLLKVYDVIFAGVSK